MLHKIIVLFLFTQLVQASESKKKLLNKVVASINNDIILQTDLDEFRSKLKSKSYQELFGPQDLKRLESTEKALDLLIEERLIGQQVKKLELTASDMEIEAQIRSILKRNHITQNQLSDQLKRLGTSLPTYKEGIKRQIERRNLVEREIKPLLENSDEQLKIYYQNNATKEDRDIQYKIAHILIEEKPGSKEPAASRAQKVYAEVSKNVGDFDKFAKEYSDDNTNSEAGGVLGSFSVNALAKEFKDIVPKTPLNNITKPIKTKAGYHIIKVIETQVGDFNSLSKDKKEALRNQMLGLELENKMNLWLERKKGESLVKKF
jgi:parvulin-like peptidyl-prolyl isomerase